MILNRLGNKKSMWKEVYAHFPKHITYAEPFFGAGGMYFNKPKSKYNYINDLDSDVYNLFKVVLNQKEDLKELLKIMPISTDLLDYWKKNKETEPIKKALRFLFLSNFTFYGKMITLRITEGNPMNMLLSSIDETFKLLYGSVFTNWDFRKFINTVSGGSRNKDELFFYCDPPYLNTGQNYETPIWKDQDLIDLIDCLVKSKAKFAVSEFSNDLTIKLAKDYKLNFICIKERRSIRNRNTEIIVTNYNEQLTLFKS